MKNMLRNFRAFLYLLITIFFVGCGGGSPTSKKPPSPTNVVILSTSTANNLIFQMPLTINSLSLVNQNGQIVSLLRSSYPEFIHVNGNPEPLATVSIPQGVYIQAFVDSNEGGVSCIALNASGQLSYNFYGDNGISLPVSVQFPQPITITGSDATLLLNLIVSQSFRPPSTGCSSSSSSSSNYSITPNFQLTAYNPPAQISSSGGSHLAGMEGIVSDVQPSASNFTVQSVDGNNYGNGSPAGAMNAASGPSWTFVTDSNTAFQGIPGISAVVANMAVDVDAAIQPDGSLLATRVAVYDTDIANTSLWYGDIAKVSNAVNASIQGSSTGFYPAVSLSIGPMLANAFVFASYAGSAYSISGQMQNISELPFHAEFSSANMIAGQQVAITMHETGFPQANILPAAGSITLIPQTLNGTVSAIGSDGGFTTYTITLAPYDLFPALAVQSGQTTLLTNPSQVVVYADSNTQMLNTNPIAVGNVVRFYGLVFNDNGTLRMDCAEVLDGVPE